MGGIATTVDENHQKALEGKRTASAEAQKDKRALVRHEAESSKRRANQFPTNAYRCMQNSNCQQTFRTPRNQRVPSGRSFRRKIDEAAPNGRIAEQTSSNEARVTKTGAKPGRRTLLSSTSSAGRTQFDVLKDRARLQLTSVVLVPNTVHYPGL